MNLILLKKLGLSDKDIKIYLTLLEHGALSVRAVSEISGVNRGTAYDILKNLVEMGLAGFFQKDSKQRFCAENPEKILKIIEKKEEELKNFKKSCQNFIPELKAFQDKGRGATSRFYEGDKGVKTILKDLLDSMIFGEEYYVYSARQSSDDIKRAFPEFSEQRIKKGIKVRAISLAEGGGLSGLDERRWLGTDEKSAVFILIYSDKCAFISRDSRKKPIGVIIENKMIYETQKTIFLSLWRFLKK